MPLSRVQTVVRGKAQDYTSPTLQSAPCRDYPTESSKMSEKCRVMEFYMGMTCEGCANAAKRVLAKLGVTEVKTDLDTKTVTVTTALPKEKILETLEKTGKEVKFLSDSSQQAVKVMEFYMEMTCEGCANAAKEVLAKLGDKVTNVVTDCQRKTVTVTTTLPDDQILEALQKTGKTVSLMSKPADEEFSQQAVQH